MKCFLTKDKISLSAQRKELMTGSKPNFDLIFQSGNSTPLVIMKNAVGLNNMLKLLVVIIEDLVNYFNVARPMNDGQITDLAVEILEEMKDITFEEIVAFIEGIKREEYGKIYERFDAPTFWKFYWGESPDDPNSYNFKKMNYCLADARKDTFSDPVIYSDLEKDVMKSRKNVRGAGTLIKDHIKHLPTQPPKDNE